jgi:hypothetical protein
MYVGYGAKFVDIYSVRATESRGVTRVCTEPKGIDSSKNSSFSGLTVGDIEVKGCK